MGSARHSHVTSPIPQSAPRPRVGRHGSQTSSIAASRSTPEWPPLATSPPSRPPVEASGSALEAPPEDSAAPPADASTPPLVAPPKAAGLPPAPPSAKAGAPPLDAPPAEGFAPPEPVVAN